MVWLALNFLVLASFTARWLTDPGPMRATLAFWGWTLLLLTGVPLAYPRLTHWQETLIAGSALASLAWLGLEPAFRRIQSARSASRMMKDLKKLRGPLYEVVEAARLLSRARLGALIVIERRKNLKSWYKRGVGLDARLSKELLFSLFTPPGALHDGAAVLRLDRILACAVILPLSRNPVLSKELGTRHRAALGISESSDALCLVVSEETGSVSLADRGRLYYDLAPEDLPLFLGRCMRFQTPHKKTSAPRSPTSPLPV